jgi:CRISPR-associated protein Cas1
MAFVFPIRGCSLHSICLPDEINWLNTSGNETTPVRNLIPARDDAKPLYVQEQGSRIGIEGEILAVKDRDRRALAEARLIDVSHVVLMGNVQISSQAMRELLGREIPVCWMSFGGRFAGVSDGLGHGNIDLRRAQFRKADDPNVCLALSRRFVRNKIANCRTMLRRNHDALPTRALEELSAITSAVDEAGDFQILLGMEGNAARIYFEAFPGMLRPAAGENLDFDFSKRTRRPPKDPVNALMSFAYSLLAKDLTVVIRLVGLDPFLGYYHKPRFGRPTLALDLMEEFRPIVVDSTVITVVNKGVVSAKDFTRSSLGVALKPEARKRFLHAYELMRSACKKR